MYRRKKVLCWYLGTEQLLQSGYVFTPWRRPGVIYHPITAFSLSLSLRIKRGSSVVAPSEIPSVVSLDSCTEDQKSISPS
ncbi:hypothetical protein PISMIDRAFT_689602 [Pisolithus microcarpus 441]|uniref:Uncharacterized protein n=1 Tax=Pisolithus microcarpus 441 TaxID=765257 RepID=A0A0C9Y5K9_9AGAM|nr:hypothetical protein PISMIDRAFT_689602 [Pisolithus microcarpus 441]